MNPELHIHPELSSLRLIILMALVVLIIACAMLLGVTWLYMQLVKAIELSAAKRHERNAASPDPLPADDLVSSVEIEPLRDCQDEGSLHCTYRMRLVGSFDARSRLITQITGLLKPPRTSVPAVADRDTSEQRSTLQKGDLVIVTRELDFSHGSGTVVPVGGFIRLINSHTTSSGIRWSGRWDGAYVSSIPPDALRKATSSENIGHSLRRFMTEADKHAE